MSKKLKKSKVTNPKDTPSPPLLYTLGTTLTLQKKKYTSLLEAKKKVVVNRPIHFCERESITIRI